MIPFKKFIPAIGWFFLVLTLICIPGNNFPKTSDWLDVIFFDKWVHIGLFGILAYICMKPIVHSSLPQKKALQIILKIALCVSIWGLTTEFIQKFFIPHRNFDLWDWAADSFGAFCAYLYCKKLSIKKSL